MLSPKAIKYWYLTHKWSSLLCTVFLLLLCVTGLPLIFHDEIDQLSHGQELEVVGPKDSETSLDTIVSRAGMEKPDWQMMFLTWDQDSPVISAVLGPSMQAGESDVLIAPFDSRSGNRLAMPPSNEGVMYFILDLHASLLMGLPGTLFLGLMGLVFLVSLVSGAVVYAPFMRRLAFATVRKHRSQKIKWLDVHNMVGIITLTWVAVVGFTGVVLTMVTPLTSLMQKNQLAVIAAPYEGQQPPLEIVTPDTVIASVKDLVPNPNLYFLSWPSSPYATPYHYTVALRGNTPLTEHLITMVLVDAITAEVTAIEDTPWYMDAINLSIPLHFGDYGGLPLKIIWALFDIAAIIVLGSGVYLWVKRRDAMKQRLKKLELMSAIEVRG